MSTIIHKKPELPDYFLRFGHRGDGVGPNENTLYSMMKALRKGANGIEYDLRWTKDREIVVFHDQDILRTTSISGNVSDYDYKELYHHKTKGGQKIPLWKDIFKYLFERIERKIFQNIELKEPGLYHDVLALILVMNAEDSVVISSFRDQWDDMSIFPDHDIPIALLAGVEDINVMTEEGFIEEAIRRKASAINPCYEAATRTLVNLAHKEGLKVYPWTADIPQTISFLKNYIKVDGIISNFPERL